MVHTRIYQPEDIKDGKCPNCKSNRLLYRYSFVECTNCGERIGSKANKYNAKKTEFKGKLYDSKHEANTAQSLELRKLAGDIKDYDTQYRIEAWCYRENGDRAFLVRHKVDFRVHNNDGSFTLVEAKGIETDDYKWRRKFLENIWLPEHPDHDYQVVKK